MLKTLVPVSPRRICVVPRDRPTLRPSGVVHCSETIPVKFLTLSTLRLVLLPYWFWAKTVSGLFIRDTAKSGFGLRILGRRVSPAVMDAIKIIATSNTHSGTGLEYLHVLNRVRVIPETSL